MRNRIEILRAHIDKLVASKKRGNLWYVERHMFSVSTFAAMIALKRGLDPEIATMIGLLHDISTLLTDDPGNHAALGCLTAQEILDQLDIVSAEERNTICTAIKNHSLKHMLHEPYSELAKDADVMSHYFFNISFPPDEREKKRIAQILAEFGINTQ